MSFVLLPLCWSGGLAMASLGPRSNLFPQETEVGSASAVGFVASSDFCIAPEVWYQVPGLTTAKLAGVPLCDADTATSVRLQCSR